MSIGGLQEVDYLGKTFGCSQCGSEAYRTVMEPIKEAGRQDYRLDAIEQPERHAAAVDRLSGRGLRVPVDYSDGELPGRKVDGAPIAVSGSHARPPKCFKHEGPRGTQQS